MRSQINQADLEWFEGESFRGHIGEPDADRVKKLCAAYRAACDHLHELDSHRNGDIGINAVRATEIALRDAVWAPLPNERIEHQLRQLGRHHDPNDDWQDYVLEAVAPEQTRVGGGRLGRGWHRVIRWLTEW